MAKETGWFRTEGGAVLEMDLPLPEAIAQRVAKKEIVRVKEHENKAGEKVWVAWEAPERDADEADADAAAAAEELAAMAEELAKANRRIVELEAELDQAAADKAALERALEEATAPPAAADTAEPKAKAKAKAE
jgi:chromosome segregation ATPase